MDKRGEEREKEFLGTGVSFPVKADPLYARIEESSYEENIKESIRIILMTSKGERAMRPEFGCDVKKYMFETLDYTTLSRLEEDVREALVRWEPRITEVEVNSKLMEDGELELEIDYTVRSTNNPYNLVFPFRLNEGYGLGTE